MRRRDFIKVVAGSATIWPLAARAQQRVSARRIGFLGSDTASQFARRLEAMREGLRDFGYVDGENIALELRYAEGNYDRLPVLVSDLVTLKVDLLITPRPMSTAFSKERSRPNFQSRHQPSSSW